MSNLLSKDTLIDKLADANLHFNEDKRLYATPDNVTVDAAEIYSHACHFQNIANEMLGIIHPQSVGNSDELNQTLNWITNEVKRIRNGIEKHATDTIWCGDHQTACDALDLLIDDIENYHLHETGEFLKEQRGEISVKKYSIGRDPSSWGSVYCDDSELFRAENISGALLKLVEDANKGASLLVREYGKERELLARAHQMINDWCVTYASEFCDEASIKETGHRIMQDGGTLAYIGKFNADYAEITKIEGQKP